MTTTVFPPGPQTPSFVQILNWIADPYGYLDYCRQHFGETFTARFMGCTPYVFLTRPQDVRGIFSVDADLYDGGSGNTIIRPLVGDNSLLLLDGARHQRQRKLLMPPFHGERMRRYGQLMVEIAAKTARDWPQGKTFTMRSQMQEVTLQIIMEAVFGLRDSDRARQLKPLLATLTNMTASPLRSSVLFFKVLQTEMPSTPWGRMMQRKQQIHDLLQAEIDCRRATDDLEGEDVLSLMMAARDEAGQPMSDVELRDELITLLLAGHETTASALAWAFYWLHRHREVREKLLAEIDRLGAHPEPTEIARLPYLSAVCNETLRIFPVVMIPSLRISRQEVTIGDRTYPAGTTLIPCIYLIHRREDLYPQPQQFRPERFIDHQFSPYEFLPFGGGNRRCLGYAMALMEMKLVLATILAGNELQLATDKPVRPQRRGVTLSPSGGVKMIKLGERKAAQSFVVASNPR